MHVRFLLVEGEKMSKSAGNFYTLRDLVAMGHKPSSIRYLLSAVPYRKQLNFTFDGLTQAAHSVERLRTFKRRLETEQFPAGKNEALCGLAERTIQEMRAGLNDDLNTAQALAAIFDMVREANAAADAGQVRQDDTKPLVEALHQFDQVFDVLSDDDAAKVSRVVAWADGEGKQVTAEARELAKAAGLDDSAIDALVAEMQAARKARDFARSDAIRAQLNESGILVEITKDGARWRRK
jgi:cysteinyl-tRNA synthetase